MVEHVPAPDKIDAGVGHRQRSDHPFFNGKCLFDLFLRNQRPRRSQIVGHRVDAKRHAAILAHQVQRMAGVAAADIEQVIVGLQSPLAGGGVEHGSAARRQ